VTPRSRPKLRLVETLIVPDPQQGRLLVLRDPQGVAAGHACLPPSLFPIVSRFTGTMTCAEIARETSAELGHDVPTEIVWNLAVELDDALFLEGPAYEAALRKVREDFHDASLRPASHAGAAYAADREELSTYLNEKCLAKAPARAASRGSLTALIAPHIDPWRGAVGYGHAYSALKNDLAPEVDTFVVFGTSHAPMDEPFALCRKGFDTPLGAMPADFEAIDRIAAKCPYDPYTDELNHKREHSIEFQAVFLKHVIGDRPARIVPVLAGLGRQQALGTDPAKDARAMALLDAVAELVAERGRRVVLVAGADLAHMGPRFGDPDGLDAKERGELARVDGESVDLAAAGDAGGFWRQVARDLDTRRVCGLSPIYAVLKTMRSGSRGTVLHYEQTIDDEDASIVSHAAVAFHA